MIWRCTDCGNEFGIPAGECPKCKSRKIAKVTEGLVSRKPARLASEISIEKKEKVRTGNDLLDVLLTGGLVRGFSILLAGARGTGKSTILAQLLASYSHLHKETGLYCTSEEEDQDVAFRMRRLELPLDRTIILSDSVGEGFLAEVRMQKPSIAVIDSVQATTYKGYPVRSIQGAAELVLAGHRYAHETQTVMIFTCQETKDGDAAGPAALGHYVDCEIHMGIDEMPYIKDGSAVFQRYIAIMKNRRGVAPIQHIVEMTSTGIKPAIKGF